MFDKTSQRQEKKKDKKEKEKEKEKEKDKEKEKKDSPSAVDLANQNQDIKSPTIVLPSLKPNSSHLKHWGWFR